MSQYLMNTYARLPISFTHGKGAWLWDTEDNSYLDALSGVAVCGLGHGHPAIQQAICEQAGLLLHTSNIYNITYQAQLAERLCQLSQMEKVFFANSGAEANEAAIKLARLYGHQQQIENAKIIVMENSFHGRTLATLSATGNTKIQQGFDPLVPNFLRVPFDDIAAIEKLAIVHKDIVAIMVEPVQGEGGVNIPAPDYLNQLRSICDQNQWLLILDEIQTGIGRTGQWFAHQHNKIVPDIMTLAKGLGNGMPIGACLARGKAAEVFAPGNHGSTFGGNLLACRVGLTVLEVIEEQGLLENAAHWGNYLLQQFKEKLGDKVKNIRGQGLMIGIELDKPCIALVTQALEQNILINVTAGNTVRLLPPLIIQESEVQEIIEKVSQLILDFIN